MNLRSVRSRLYRRPEITHAVLIFIAVFVYFTVTQPGFATVNNIYTIMQGMVFLGLGALAFGLTMIAGEMDLAVPGTATVAGVLAIKVADNGLVASLAVAIGVGLLVGLVQGVFVSVVRLHSVVITLGTSAALIGLATILSGTSTVVSPDLELAKQVQSRWFILSPGSLIAIGVFVLVGVGLQHTSWGAEVRSIGGGRIESIAAGVPTWRPIVLIFIVSGVLAALLGALASISVGSVSASSFDSLLLNAVAAALIGGVSLAGGRGSAFGIATGVITLRFVNSGLSLAGQPFYVINLAIGLLLLFVVLLDLLTSTDRRARRALRNRGPGGPQKAPDRPTELAAGTEAGVAPPATATGLIST